MIVQTPPKSLLQYCKCIAKQIACNTFAKCAIPPSPPQFPPPPTQPSGLIACSRGFHAVTPPVNMPTPACTPEGCHHPNPPPEPTPCPSSAVAVAKAEAPTARPIPAWGANPRNNTANMLRAESPPHSPRTPWPWNGEPTILRALAFGPKYSAPSRPSSAVAWRRRKQLP